MRAILFFAAALLSAGQLASCEANEQRPPENAAGRTQRTGVWIDVRSPEEFATGHLAGATNIPHDEIAGRIAALVPDKSTEIHLYCRSGRRSGLAREVLLGQGYTKVTNDGAYEDLKKEGETASPQR